MSWTIDNSHLPQGVRSSLILALFPVKASLIPLALRFHPGGWGGGGGEFTSLSLLPINGFLHLSAWQVVQAGWGEKQPKKSRESWLLMLSITEPSTAACHPHPGSHFLLWISFTPQPRSSVSLGCCPLGILSHLACPLYRPSVRKAIRLTLLHWNINTIQLPSPSFPISQLLPQAFILLFVLPKGGITCQLNSLMSLRISYFLIYLGNYQFYFLPEGLTPEIIGRLDKNKWFFYRYGLFVPGNQRTT